MLRLNQTQNFNKNQKKIFRNNNEMSILNNIDTILGSINKKVLFFFIYLKIKKKK